MRVATTQQQAVYDAVRATRSHVNVEAVAGSGKSTTAVGCAYSLPQGTKVGFVAFNKHIANELQAKLGGRASACTLHSLGFTAVRKAFPGVEVDEQKPRRLLERMRPRWAFQGKSGRLVWDDRGQAALSLAGLCKKTLADPTLGELLRLADYYGVELPSNSDVRDDVRDAVAELLDATANQTAVIDYDDMLWLPVRLGLSPERYALLLVDEAQDLSRCQQELARRAGDRLVVLGDRAQCQPAGSMITVLGGARKPIEDIRPGQVVASFDRDSSIMVGRSRSGPRVSDVASRHYVGDLITVEAAGCQTRCTPDHRWVARFVDRDSGIWVTYLMRRGNRFRVGWCQLFDSTGGLHLGARARVERAEQAWILGVYRDKTAASIGESVIATRFGLPTLPFEQVNGAQHLTREAIDQFFAVMENEGFLESRAQTCLADFGRDIVHPFYRTDFQQRQGRTTIFETQACNLVSGLMAVPIYNPCDGYFPEKPVWAEANVSRNYFEGVVYSLKVEGPETYVADGLVTHNSIYGFTGADPDSLPALVGELGTQPAGCLDRPLTVTFRCPESHVALAQHIVPQIEAAPGAKEGVVRSMDAGDLPSQVVPGDLVVCRKNAPLVSLAFKLIRRGVPAVMLGRDFAKGLVDLCGRMKADSPVDLIAKLRNHLAREIERLDRRDAPESQIQGVQDRVACLVDLASTAASIGELNGHIGRLFSDTADKAAVVTLASIHRAKGSEARRVFVVEPECLPMVGRKTKTWEHRQELNLAYVAATRAKESLTFAGPVPACLGGPPRQVRDPRPEAVVTL